MVEEAELKDSMAVVYYSLKPPNLGGPLRDHFT